MGQSREDLAIFSLSDVASGAAPKKSGVCAEKAVLPTVRGLVLQQCEEANSPGHGLLYPPQPAKGAGQGPEGALLPFCTPWKRFYNEVRPEPSEPKGIRDVVLCAHMLASWGNFNE